MFIFLGNFMEEKNKRIKFSISGTSLRKFFKETKNQTNFVVNISYVKKVARLNTAFLDKNIWTDGKILDNDQCLSSIIDDQNIPFFNKKECKLLTIAYPLSNMLELIGIVTKFKPITFNFSIDEKYGMLISFPIGDYGNCSFCYRPHNMYCD